MSAALIKLEDLRVIAQGDEPRIQDWKLALALGFKAPRQIRELIERYRAELERYGGLSCRTTNPGPLGGRPATEYWLNEAQAILICMRSDAPRAADVRQEVITVYQVWRRGELAPLRETPNTNEIHDLFATVGAKLDQQGIKLEEQCQLQYQMQDNIITIKQWMERLPQRIQRPSKEDERILYQVVHLEYRNKCPIDKTTRLTDDKGNRLPGTSELDHMTNHTRPTSPLRGYDWPWRRLRKRHLAQYPWCVRCGARGVDVDHVVPVRIAPDRRLDPTNLAPTAIHATARSRSGTTTRTPSATLPVVLPCRACPSILPTHGQG
jgi:hypothetical protein